MKDESEKSSSVSERSPCFLSVPVGNQARFTLISIFRESVEFCRNYTLPWNILDICSRSEGKDASRVVNLKTGEECSSRENQVSLYPCNLPQQYRHTLRNEHLSIHFKLELFPGVDVYSGQDHIVTEYSPELTERVRKIFDVRDQILLLSLCQEFALHFCHRHWPKKYAFELISMRRFSEVLQYVRSSADARTGIGELAGLMHMPESTFCRRFSETFRVTPKQFLQQELFSQAVKLVLSPDMTVKEAAERLKFSSEFYFSHFFKRMCGLSPRQYRERHVISVGR